MINRVYVEKKDDSAARELFCDLKDNLKIAGLTKVRLFNRYDCEGLDSTQFKAAVKNVFSEAPVDKVYDELPQIDDSEVFVVAYLPGQYDQRADFAEQCIKLGEPGARVKVLSSRVIVLIGDKTKIDIQKIKDYYINKVESYELSDDKLDTLEQKFEVPERVAILDGFNEGEAAEIISKFGLAMDEADLKCCQEYFRSEGRQPTITELRVLDTYWSDHCRHTTFATHLDDIKIEDDYIKKTFDEYMANRNPKKPITLMDMATAAMKRLKSNGELPELDESEEINACSIEVDNNGEAWLVMFKNETHNHPTEIEPFGGAATCLGGAIRDPLSGRAYVYQAMRVTGCGDPRTKIEDTIKGKLPQRKITTTAAAGYSSYGNQIGLATGMVSEVYDEGYVAKRMELGAVIAATPKKNVVRERPEKGDVVILLGGRTGRDGCGGATGSSKTHTQDSLETCGSEVQKGNAPEERKILRLFRKHELTTLIKRCNDFGAGGVCVAIGELSDGLNINLDKVTKKYEGLDGTELAISESQERMAVVVRACDAEKFIAMANDENLEATIVAEITDDNRLTMMWNGQKIVDIAREFLDTNGADRSARVAISGVDLNALGSLKNLGESGEFDSDKSLIKAKLSSLEMCSQKGLIERFDSTIGGNSVFAPLGGKYQLTPTQAMVGKLPMIDGETDVATFMSYAYNPQFFKVSPYHGACYAVLESVAKLVAAGCDYSTIYLTFQEYFEKMLSAKSWGKVASALLGAYDAQMRLHLAAIGGKDSMSGSFEDINVPPTFVSFAVGVGKASLAISPEFKQANSTLILASVPMDDNLMADYESAKNIYSEVYKYIAKGKVLSAYSVGYNGIAGLATSTFGNKIGMQLNDVVDINKPMMGSIVLEVSGQDASEMLGGLNGAQVIGQTIDSGKIVMGGEEISIDEAISAWESTLEPIFPTVGGILSDEVSCKGGVAIAKAGQKFGKPTVFVPVFPGTNCEYDTSRAFSAAGANIDCFVIKNQTKSDIETSVNEIARRIDNSQIIMLSGGFSAGDEPDGSAKFIANMLRNAKIAESITKLLESRDGLMLGICNGFQALIKLGLVLGGKICEINEDSPTLTYNTIGRHISHIAKTRVASNLSPWLSGVNVGDEFMIPISHGEGRFVANDEWIAKLVKNGQVATQYVGENLNNSCYGIEGITSPDGRVLGKMGHSERVGDNVIKNIPGDKEQFIFKSGVEYFM
ncbi:MAG: phosphoribosylformylglycinamidine synthase [Clostridiales bacterium]|jgi:phosphoribosylformylglycinamidine synthase|nr:phosphoribosylformylglycinamidine synthase [Clostridiales bacterium]